MAPQLRAKYQFYCLLHKLKIQIVKLRECLKLEKLQKIELEAKINAWAI
jgi:hypothetical protein